MNSFFVYFFNIFIFGCGSSCGWRRKWQPTPAFLPGNSTDRSWWAAVHGVSKSQAWLSYYHPHYLRHVSIVALWNVESYFPDQGLNPWKTDWFFFNWLINFNWRIITILWWLCHTSELIGHRCTCVPHPEPLRPTLSIWVVPEHWLWVPCFIHQTYSGEDRFWTNGPRGESPRDELCFFPFILFFFQLCVTC